MKDWLLTAMEDNSITPEQLKTILEDRSKRDREFQDFLRVFQPPIPMLTSSLDLLYLPVNIEKE